MLKKLSPLLIILILIFCAWFISYSSMPGKESSSEIPETEFSTERAFLHIENIAQTPHYLGSSAHSRIRNYIVNELQELGLEVQMQEGYSINNKGVITRPQNILARIPGSEEGSALLLMSHYDSAGHSSPGASDAASGVATILEGIRAFIKNGKANKNEIILLFTDAEELGLNGADLFVKEHPWSKNVGLALNFEARGSGGNSFMLLETNSGNAALIREFIKAKPDYPVTNSLAYSVYKMLPNDTDLTVLREQANINGYNFAFIDDHFDYHTASDIPENLDRETLAHQGSYLMPLLDYFKDANFSELNSEEDLIYFSLPVGKIISYPFSYIFPMLILAFISFFLVLGYGIFRRKHFLRSVLKGMLPFFISLIGSGILAYLLWMFCLMIYPEYSEMEHGFTYNGYYYIAAVIFLTLSINLFAYHKFSSKDNKAGYLVFPLFFWLLICLLVAFFLKGAAYFILPAFFAILQLGVMLRQKQPNLFLMLLLSLPALVILLPFITTFPVALGLKILFVTAILTTFLFLFFLPVFTYFKLKKALALLCFLIFNVLFITAHFKSSFTEERPKPNSLVYLFNADTKEASWNSYDLMVDSWTSEFFGEDPVIIPSSEEALQSKYGSNFTFKAKAPLKNIPEPGVVFEKLNPLDSLDKTSRYSLKIAPNRKINRMELYVDRKVDFEEFKVNGLTADSIDLGANSFHVFTKRWHSRLLTYHAANRDTLSIEFVVKEEKLPEFLLFESSYDLLENPEFDIPERKKSMIPRPFVVNDALTIRKTIKFN
ncbi:M28 family peptidase [Gillisia limnaea]|uniref:Vacuolar membrane protease n=1 Tax=Gillisia limnaea (strain DSM 15749 / LMG 21470 / R-8282) TaxID=865937 RepID=H2BWQ6_GILLR|nr:M28 family peptidase [Gillisia limnaea]EHQ03034.1 peptidase M28 [Gillisia limnaea DSM 15749]